MSEPYQFVPKKLTKRNLTTFFVEYEAALFRPVDGTPEQRRAGYVSEWSTLNEALKLQGKNKKQRRRKREALKVKWGIRVGYKTKITLARLSLIQSIKKTFDL